MNHVLGLELFFLLAAGALIFVVTSVLYSLLLRPDGRAPRKKPEDIS